MIIMLVIIMIIAVILIFLHVTLLRGVSISASEIV